MKKTISIFILCMTYVVSFSQVLPNNSFENWTGGKPDSWDTSNEVILGNTITTVIQDTSSIDGSYAPRIKTAEITILTNTITFPGLITLGDFVFDLAGPVLGIEGGIAFTARPDSLTGYYVASPAAGDSALMVIGLAKYSSTTGRDTIGYGYQYFPAAVSTWTPFSIPITWTSPDNPDSLNIIIGSSDLYSMSLVNGSTIWVDKLSFVYNATTIADIDFDQGIMVYPDNTGQQLIVHFKNQSGNISIIRLFNISGELIYENNENYTGSDHYITISSYTKGTYIIEVISGKNERFTQKILIH